MSLRRVDGSYVEQPKTEQVSGSLFGQGLSESIVLQCKSRLGIDVPQLELLYQQFGPSFFAMLNALLSASKSPMPESHSPAKAPGKAQESPEEVQDGVTSEKTQKTPEKKK